MSANNNNNKRKAEKNNLNDDDKNLFNENEKIYTLNSNEIIFFKIINDENEFYDFQKFNLINSFQPKFSLQLFENEKIFGYKNLKILISLTSKLFFPHIKISFDKKIDSCDQIETIFKNHFQNNFTFNEKEFLNKLNEEKNFDFKDLNNNNLIFKSNDKEIYFIDIIKDNFVDKNFHFQAICNFFIDAASFIPIYTNFWNYFVIISRKNDNSKDFYTIGFTSFKNFHKNIHDYTTMISQFLILTPYQRKGNGILLLNSIYNYLKKDEKCKEITTEDPDIEFILMRDVLICENLIKEKNFIEKFFKNLKFMEFSNLDEINNFNEVFYNNKENIENLTKKYKLQKNLIKRGYEILKLYFCGNKFESKFKEDKINCFIEQMKKDEPKKIFDHKKFGKPIIFFHNDSDFNVDEIMKEEININAFNFNEKNLKQKAEDLFMEYEKDIKLILPKIGKIVFEFKKTLE